MKTHLRFLLVAASFAACSFAAQPFRSFELDIAQGSSPAVVTKVLGQPSAILGKDLWVYFNFARSNPNVANPAFDTLVIAFDATGVMAVKITDGRVVRKLLAEQKAALPAALLAKK